MIGDNVGILVVASREDEPVEGLPIQDTEGPRHRLLQEELGPASGDPSAEPGLEEPGRAPMEEDPTRRAPGP